MASPRIVGSLGAGTMGAGIAQLAAAAGARTLVHDPDAEALERGLAGIAERLEHEVEKGRLEAGAAGPVEGAAEVAGLAEADIIIEAAPESLELKRSLFGSVAEVVRQDCVLATNTSSLSVTEVAAGVPGPERVVGMHFFNPAPVMKLVEVVAGEQSGESALETTRELGRAMGRHVIDAGDGPGFLVNRCGRPFGLEALRVVQEGLATTSRSTASAGSAAGSGWARSSSWTSSASTSASRSRSPSTTSPSASRGGVRRCSRRARRRRGTSGARPAAAGTSTPATSPIAPRTRPRRRAARATAGSW